MTLILMRGSPAEAQVAVPTQAPGGDRAAESTAALETVGLALLAYGLVQILGRVLDKVLASRGGSGEGGDPSAGFREEDRRRLAKSFELLQADRERLRHMAEALAAVQEQTRWLSEQRARSDPADGEPMWNCRGRLLAEQLQAQQRLMGQALDDLRVLNQQNQTVIRRLGALWRRALRRKRDR